MPPHIVGQVIGHQAIQNLATLREPGLGIEILYSFIIIACSLMIYFGTKELYELSSHKGLKYFRLSFLFFALAYFFRSFIKLTLITINQLPMEFKISLDQITFMLFIYFSTMAILFLLYSVTHKSLYKQKHLITILNIIAIVVAFLVIILRSQIFYLILNLSLLSFAILTFLISKKKKKNNLHIIYTLMAIFWTINVLDILIPNFLQTTQIIIYLASSTIFLIMLYKVLTKAGSK